MLQKKRPKTAGSNDIRDDDSKGNSESKGSTKKEGGLRGRRNSIAALLEGKLGDGLLKKKKFGVSKVNRKRSGKASKVRELASAFKRAQQALQNAQAHKSYGSSPRDTKTSSNGNQSTTPNRVPAKIIADLESRLALGSKKPSPLTKQAH